MITTKIQIEEYLKEFLTGKYNGGDAGAPVRFPDDSDLYHFIFDLMVKRPADCPVDTGNLEIVLPHRSIGKQPDTYNYISARGAEVFEERVWIAFNAELHDFISEKKHLEGMTYKDAMHLFITKYNLEGISDEGIKKNYYRWRNKMRKIRK